MKPGTIVILNGTSSSGKSTIAKILQPLLPGHFLHLGIDQYMARVPESFDVFSDGRNSADAEGILWIRREGRATSFPKNPGVPGVALIPDPEADPEC